MRNSKTIQISEPQVLTHQELGIMTKGLKRKLQHQDFNPETLNDDLFDLVFSPEVRNHSKIHWTPLKVAVKAAEILRDLKVERLLDVGSGCGKFCLLTSILTDVQVTGVEQRDFLATSAKKPKIFIS